MKTEIERARESIKEYRKVYGQSQLPTDCIIQLMMGHAKSEQLLIHSVSNRFSDPKFIDNVCLSYRHDFGLLSEDEQNKVRFECKEWMRAIKNNEPY